MRKLIGVLAGLSAATLIAPSPAFAEKALARVFDDISVSRPGVLVLTRKYVPFNGNEPVTLVYLMNCQDETWAFVDANSQKIVVKKFPLYKRNFKLNGLSTESKICNLHYY